MIKKGYGGLVLVIFLLLFSNIAFGLPVKKMNNVSDEMLNVQFWIDKISDANDILMSGEEIASFNKDIQKKLPDFVYDMASFKDKFSKKDLTEYIDVKFPTEPCYVNGKQLGKSYWDKLRKQINILGIGESNDARYGFIVRRTNLKIFPTSDIVSDDPKDICYDQFQNSGILVNEPVLVLHRSFDSKWLYVFMYNCSGWVLAKDIALCPDKETWLKDQSFKDFLVVTGNKIRLEPDPYSPETSELELSMGTVLQIADESELPNSINERALYDNYVVKIPVRGEHGELVYKLALLPVSRDVSYGFLPYTRANVLKQAFKMQGDRYGWGGMLNSRDCSEFVLEVYRCFGFKFPRNSQSQADVPCKTADFTDMSIEEKGKLLDSLAPGSTLHFPGHVMIYIGKDSGRYYIISDLGSFAEFEPGATKGTVIRTRSVVINDLSIKRASGKQWIEALTTGKQYEKTKFKDLEGISKEKL